MRAGSPRRRIATEPSFRGAGGKPFCKPRSDSFDYDFWAVFIEYHFHVCYGDLTIAQTDNYLTQVTKIKQMTEGYATEQERVAAWGQQAFDADDAKEDRLAKVFRGKR